MPLAPRCRRLAALAGLAACSLLLSGCGRGEPPNERVTQENLRRIEVGMTRQQVEAILGPGSDIPARDQRVSASFQGNSSWAWAVWVRDPSAETKEYIVVGFGPDGKVAVAYRGWESKVGG